MRNSRVSKGTDKQGGMINLNSKEKKTKTLGSIKYGNRADHPYHNTVNLSVCVCVCEREKPRGRGCGYASPRTLVKPSTPFSIETSNDEAGRMMIGTVGRWLSVSTSARDRVFPVGLV